jgi:hypothetical protein
MIHRKLSAAWEQWQQVAAEMKHTQHSMGGAIRRMLNRKLSMAWEKWQQTAAEMKQQEQLMKHALMRMIQRKLAMAFDTWHAEYALAFEQHNLRMRALFCWTHREFSAAFNTWVDVAAHARASQNLLEWSVRRWQHQSLSSGFNTWCEHYASAMEQKNGMMRAAKFWDLSTRNAITRLFLGCFNKWRAEGCSAAVRRALAFKAALRWQNQKLAGAFHTWRDSAAERTLLKQMYDWVAYHWVLREKRWAHHLWLHKARHARKHSTSSRALSHWLNKAKSAAFNKWVEFATERSMAEALLRKSLLAWTHKALLAGLNTWQNYILEMQEQKALLYKSTVMWTRGALVRAFNQWRWVAEAAAEQKELLYKAMFRWAHKALGEAFNTWLNEAAGMTDMEEAIMIASQHYKFSALSAALAHWRDVNQALRQQASSSTQDVYKADHHLRESRLREGFSRWLMFHDAVASTQSSPAPVVTPPPARAVSPSTAPTSRTALACEPYGLFSVIISRTTYGKQDRALYYVVEVTLEGRRKFEINKRYRDFDLLNTVLSERFSRILTQGVGGTTPTLPPKKSFTKLNPEFYESRALELHQFVQDLLAYADIAASAELCDFLQFHTFFQ